jgi:hypothetical protein
MAQGPAASHRETEARRTLFIVEGFNYGAADHGTDPRCTMELALYSLK